MKVTALVLSALVLTACSTTEPTVTTVRHRVVLPEESMYACETVERFPDSRTLTDLQVARLLVELHQNNVRCRNSIETIRHFLESARVRLEEGRESPVREPQSDSPRRVPVR
jgi:hypothetical protein